MSVIESVSIFFNNTDDNLTRNTFDNFIFYSNFAPFGFGINKQDTLPMGKLTGIFLNLDYSRYVPETEKNINSFMLLCYGK